MKGNSSSQVRLLLFVFSILELICLISGPAAAACADVFFEVEGNPIAAAFDTSPQYHLTAEGVPTKKAGDLLVTTMASVFLSGNNQMTTNGNGGIAAWRTDAYERFLTKPHRGLRLI